MESTQLLGSFGPELPFTTAELDACMKVTACLSEHRRLFPAPWLRPLRKSVVALAELIERRNGQSIGHKRTRELQAMKQALLAKTRHEDEEATRQCRLRAGRVAKLQKLMDDQALPMTTPLIPDGAVREEEMEMPLVLLGQNEATGKTDRVLFYPRQCYVCNLHFTQLHDFYDKLCPDCAQLNYAKRYQTADLHGKVALVTGARIKIGFFTTLKLLQAGATVVATTRFPCDATERFKRESQYEQFKYRLHIFGVDLRDLVHLHCFLDYVDTAFPRLDIIIHNAAQTVRRPPQFYRHLIDKEVAFDQQVLSQQSEQPLVAQYAAFQSKPDSQLQCLDRRTDPINGSSMTLPRRSAVIAHSQWTTISSALKSQVPLLSTDSQEDPALFPPGIVDVNGQQLDLRPKTSWLLRLGEVETPEVAEVLTINAMAPFAINNRLLAKLEKSAPEEAKFIVHVSAMEGKFNRAKQAGHPHTNMAKAALNMMTRTCAADLSRRKVFMTSVDTGWINDENPLPVASKSATERGFQTPLDEIDAAARVLDPIFSAVAQPTTRPQFGCFLKDYKPTGW